MALWAGGFIRQILTLLEQLLIMKRLLSSKFVAMLAVSLAWMPSSGLGQLRGGGVASDFEIPSRLSGEKLRLYDFEGSIIVLDFFAYWCPPCRTSTPVLKRDIDEYYAEQGGNPAGIPVKVLPVNIESEAPELTDQFIATYGLEEVADDLDRVAFSPYAQGAIPHFVIINGVTDSSSHRAWQILHSQAGFAGAETFRALIDQVKGPQVGPPPFEYKIEEDFGPLISASFTSAAIQADGKWLVGGAGFAPLEEGGDSRIMLERFLSDGSRDASFTPCLQSQHEWGYVRAIEVGRHGEIWAGGSIVEAWFGSRQRDGLIRRLMRD